MKEPEYLVNHLYTADPPVHVFNGNYIFIRFEHLRDLYGSLFLCQYVNRPIDHMVE